MPVVSNTQNKKKTFLYQFVLKNSKRTLLISASSEEERNEWITILKKSIIKTNLLNN
jgi:hypothetical protein